MVWLVTGGAGYIGSHVVSALIRSGRRVVVIDDLSTGSRDRLFADVPFVRADCADGESVRRVCHDYEVSGVIHLAARKQARESVDQPLEYWTTNIGAVQGLLRGTRNSSVCRVVLSSSCSIFGSAGPVRADSPLDPMSPYARTKVASEWLFTDALPADVKFIALRYFNVIGNESFPGAHDTSPESLIPATYNKLAIGEKPIVFGLDHETPDGSCLRDYLDVRDLADAHIRAVQYLERGESEHRSCVNLGTGRPISVLEMLSGLCEAMGVNADYTDGGRKDGDPAAIWVVPDEATRSLLQPHYSLKESLSAFVSSRRLVK